MKLLIASDTHHSIGNLYDAIERERPDAVLHLGDHQSDAEDLACVFPSISFYTVPGNCDHNWTDETDRLLILGGVRIFMTHGHRYGVKSGYDRLLLAAKQAGAALALFGHTHCYYQAVRDGVCLLNPGAQQFVRILAENGTYTCERLSD